MVGGRDARAPKIRREQSPRPTPPIEAVVSDQLAIGEKRAAPSETVTAALKNRRQNAAPTALLSVIIVKCVVGIIFLSFDDVNPDHCYKEP